MLLRSYVEHALYARAQGYFAVKHVVGRLRKPMPFHQFRDEAAYRQAVRDMHENGDSDWLTPSEQFTPFYGEAFGRSIVARHRAAYPTNTPLQLVEVGGGNGTFARDILQYLRRDEPELYSTCRYLLVEIAPPLAEAQRSTIGAALGEEELASRVQVINEDARTWAEGRPAELTRGPWWFNLMEVLDNLGHDRMRATAPRYESHAAAVLEQAYVRGLEGHADPIIAGLDGGRDTLVQWEQDYEPLSDPVITTVAEVLGLSTLDALHQVQAEVAATSGAAPGAELASGLASFFGGVIGSSGGGTHESVDVWVPTGCYRLVHALCRAAPQHEFSIADYSWLPPQPDGAINAPVVQTQRGGQTLDLRGDPLKACGNADILFPTNFDQLAKVIAAASADVGGKPAGEAIEHMPTSEFMTRWHTGETRAADGYDPLVDDYSNTAVLTTSFGAR